jgi:hypothetical protein
MFNPVFEILVFPTTAEPTFFEVISEDAIQDQYLAWRDASFGALMTTLGSSHSEVELEAVRRLILERDWGVKYSNFYEEAYAYVVDGNEVWTRLFKSELRDEVYQMVGLQETALAAHFNDLIDQLADATGAANERLDRAYPARSAGRFAKAS